MIAAQLRDLLHDLVLAVVAKAEVGLDDRGDEVAERVGRLADPQDVVVHVLVVGVEVLGDTAACSRRMSPLIASRIGTTRRWKRTSARRISNQCRCCGGIERLVGEDALADLVVEVVERLDGVEVAVDDDVEQAVEQEADAECGEVGRAVPAVRAPASIEKPSSLRTVISQRSFDERVDLGLVEIAALGVDPDRVARQEQVRGVVVELGSLVRARGRPRRRARAGRARRRARGAGPSKDRRGRPKRRFRVVRDARRRPQRGSPRPREFPSGTPWSSDRPRRLSFPHERVWTLRLGWSVRTGSTTAPRIS